ncbi:MAG TPA: sugar transferase [Pilimelia sp.]|nr:sugar transferase [Pilimelia sp.]
MKRAFDVVVASAAVMLLSPMIVAVWLIVLLTMGRPVLFRHVRPGLNGVPFTIYKFRTMRPPKRLGGELYDDAERLTPTGRFLRSTSLDELPELFNVLKGDMSLVGPRPLLVEYLSLYTPEQARRHLVRPGITGLAQISGRNELDWERRLELDIHYVDHRSLWLDLRILASTLPRTVGRHGISAAGHATSPLFTGQPSASREAAHG